MATVIPTSQVLAAESIKRRRALASVAINTSLESCDVIDVQAIAGGSIKVPASVTGLVFYGMEDASDASPGAIRVADSLASGLTAGEWVDFPPEVFPHGFIKIQSVGANSSAAKISFKT